MTNFPLIHLGPVPLAFFCHNCALEVDEGFCPLCGAKLTARDLTLKSNARTLTWQRARPAHRRKECNADRRHSHLVG